MAHPLTVPTIMALTLTGSGLGLYLGNSAIGEINPAYFSSPASSRFHADLVRTRPDWDNGPALRNASLTAGLGSGCVGCATYPEEYVPVPDPAIESYVSVYDPAPAADIIEEVDREIDEGARRAHREAVQRYAHYPITTRDEAAVRVTYGTPATEQAIVLSDGGCIPGNTCAGAATPGI